MQNPTNTHSPAKLQIRIDWSDLDYFGHVNNVSFFKYIQSARVNYWEIVGISAYHLEHKIGPMLASCQCTFKKELQYPGEIYILSKLIYLKNSSFSFQHQLYNGLNQLAAEAQDVMVMYDFTQNKSVPIPDVLRENIRRFEEGS